MKQPKRHLRVTFTLPGYIDVPIGGYRVVYQYADALSKRGHDVSIVFPEYIMVPKAFTTPFHRLRRAFWRYRTRVKRSPLVTWHRFHPRTRLILVSELSNECIPDGDVVVATAWSTAVPINRLSEKKGKKHYFIQGYEAIFGPKEQVDATWRLPLTKIVISKWLESIGLTLGADCMRHIPNGIDFEHFRIITPPETRAAHIATMYHRSPFKGAADAIAVLERFHQKYPLIPVTIFGVPEPGREIPPWVRYVRNPDQDYLSKEIYNRATIYLSASKSEGWGLTPAEGMACGCAFVGTDIGGFGDYAINGRTALLSPLGDHTAMFDNLVRVTEDGNLRQLIQRQGTEWISQFTWERASTAMEQLFLDS